MKKNKKTRLTVNIENELYNVIRIISQSLDMTMGEVVELALQKIYDEYDEETKEMIQKNDKLREKLMEPLKIKSFDFEDDQEKSNDFGLLPMEYISDEDWKNYGKKKRK